MSSGVAWILLFLAGCCEVVWAIGLKKYGFTWTWGGAFTCLMMIVSFLLLERAVQVLPIGTSYAIWTGMGATGGAIIGILYFHEPRNVSRMICIGLIVAGIVGLKLLSPPDVKPTRDRSEPSVMP